MGKPWLMTARLTLILLALVFAGTSAVAGESAAANIRKLTGKHTRLVWVRGTNGKGNKFGPGTSKQLLPVGGAGYRGGRGAVLGFGAGHKFAPHDHAQRRTGDLVGLRKKRLDH